MSHSWLKIANTVNRYKLPQEYNKILIKNEGDLITFAFTQLRFCKDQSHMDKQEYLSNEYLKYLDNMDKEGMMDAITPLIKRLPSYTLKRLLR